METPHFGGICMGREPDWLLTSIRDTGLGSRDGGRPRHKQTGASVVTNLLNPKQTAFCWTQ